MLHISEEIAVGRQEAIKAIREEIANLADSLQSTMLRVLIGKHKHGSIEAHRSTISGIHLAWFCGCNDRFIARIDVCINYFQQSSNFILRETITGQESELDALAAEIVAISEALALKNLKY